MIAAERLNSVSLKEQPKLMESEFRSKILALVVLMRGEKQQCSYFKHIEVLHRGVFKISTGICEFGLVVKNVMISLSFRC